MIKEKIAKLIDVKSIVTFLLTIVFCYLGFTKHISTDMFMAVFTTVIAFYFGTQTQKNKNE